MMSDKEFYIQDMVETHELSEFSQLVLEKLSLEDLQTLRRELKRANHKAYDDGIAEGKSRQALGVFN